MCETAIVTGILRRLQIKLKRHEKKNKNNNKNKKYMKHNKNKKIIIVKNMKTS